MIKPAQPARQFQRPDGRAISNVAAGLYVTTAALLLRWPHFGDPAFMIDEQFYLLVGDRMLRGALPFVDIWDRKPIGLFLIYAAIRLLGGDGVIQYQVVATFFAGATAFTLFLIARRSAGDWGALSAALLYLLWLELAEGGGGQAPVFYNLFMALGAFFTLRAGQATNSTGFMRAGAVAMALAGLAIQIKYTAVFEACFFGLVLAAGAWRRLPSKRSAMLATAALAGIALTPTLLAFLIFWSMGAGEIFWFANFESIFLRGSGDASDIRQRLEKAALCVAPLFICSLAGYWLLRMDRREEIQSYRRFSAGWLVAALIGYAAVGTFYHHYLLPLLLPVSLAAAPVFGRLTMGPLIAAVVGVMGFSTLGYPAVERTRTHSRQIAALTDLIPADVDRRCMLVFDGPAILYKTTGACFPTSFPFPDHLSAANEEYAIGIDTHAELRRILAMRPRAIVLSWAFVREPNRTNLSVMRTALAQQYQLAGISRFENRDIYVYITK